MPYKIMTPNFNLRGKKVLVMGLGLHDGGVGTVRFLAKTRAKITVTDLRSAKKLAASLQTLKPIKNIRYILGRHRKKDFHDADLIVKNPGVPPYSPYLAYARKLKKQITSDVGIFFKYAPTFNIIGITGTRGKSTTAALIAQFLQKGKKRVFLAGNIRKSVLELLEKLRPADIVVLELSSFQLEDLRREKKSPPFAVLTNIMPDHLNRYPNVQEYIRAKSNIFAFQAKSDCLFYNPNDPQLVSLVKRAQSRLIPTHLAKPYQHLVDKKLGKHQRAAAALAIAVAKHFHVPDTLIRNALNNFPGLEGRQEILKSKRGINFVNDTASTMPEATMAAVNRFYDLKSRGKKLILIAGGEDKKLNFKKLAGLITQRVDILILLPGSATEKLKKELALSAKRPKTKPFMIETNSMKQAVKKACDQARRGDWIILSPAAASFNLFLNEFDRGKKFLQAVKDIFK